MPLSIVCRDAGMMQGEELAEARCSYRVVHSYKWHTKSVCQMNPCIRNKNVLWTMFTIQTNIKINKNDH